MDADKELKKWVEDFCERHNCMVFVAMAVKSTIIDLSGDIRVSIVTRSKIVDELLPPIKELLQVEIDSRAKDRQKDIN